MLKNKITDEISKILKSDNFKLLTPSNSDFGDYAIFNKNDVSDKFSNHPLFEKVEEKDNFINFFISRRVLINEVFKIIEQKEKYGLTNKNKPLRINIEFGQPNTHKLPHIGHLFSYCYGDSLSHIFENFGHKIFRCNYQGDIGLHVAKCIYQIQKLKVKSQNLNSLKREVDFLQTCYQDGSKAYEEDKKARQQIDELNKKIYDKDPDVYNLWQKTRKWSLDYYKSFEDPLGIKFDKYYFESEVWKRGLQIVKDNIGKIFEESEGAVVFRGEKYGSHTRVFINKQGYPTYEAKDLGLIINKSKINEFDKYLITTASEQNQYWQVVKKTIELTQPKLKDKIEHIGFGMVTLKSGKLSSRSGEIIGAVELTDEVKKRIEKIMEKNKEKYSLEEYKKIVNTVSVAAIKFGLLKSEAKKNIVFDIDQSVATVGASGPYLLYTYARAVSVLTKANVDVIARSSQIEDDKTISINQFQPIKTNPDGTIGDQLQQSELSLLRLLPRCPEADESAYLQRAPHHICTYLYQLAREFNLFYEKCPILKAEDRARTFRLNLTAATAQILKNGLQLLGIETLDRV